MIQPGTYRARADARGVKFGESANGNEQIAVPFTFLDERIQGQTIIWIGNFANEKAVEITIEGLQTAGWTGDNITELVGLGDVEVDLVVFHEEYNGEVRAKVKFINAAGGSRFKFKAELDEGRKVDLAERIRGHAIAAREKKGGGAAPAARAAEHGGYRPQRPNGSHGSSGSKDDLPF